MTRPASVIYLPPGVVAPQSASAPPSNSGVPFDREFFERVIASAVRAFCDQVGCTSPIVELLTVDGSRHFIKGISGVTDTWVALHTQSEQNDHAVQVFIPYSTIFRVEIHPGDEMRQRRLGFIVPQPHEAPLVIAAGAAPAGQPAPDGPAPGV